MNKKELQHFGGPEIRPNWQRTMERIVVNYFHQLNTSGLSWHWEGSLKDKQQPIRTLSALVGSPRTGFHSRQFQESGSYCDWSQRITMKSDAALFAKSFKQWPRTEPQSQMTGFPIRTIIACNEEYGEEKQRMERAAGYLQQKQQQPLTRRAGA